MLDDLMLGKQIGYPRQYAPEVLQAIPRQLNRDKIQVSQPLPFFGGDIWNAYELSWLNPKGKPVVAIGRFTFPCDSPFLVESKSFKLYLNSLNNERFESFEAFQAVLHRDLENALKAPIKIELFTALTTPPELVAYTSTCLDDLDIPIDGYTLDPTLLRTENEIASEILHSHLLKSNCPVTNQPDWGSIEISYTGRKIDHASLLRYIVSYRNHQEFRECCVERIFMDIQRHCEPERLTVYVGEARRGGLDINPYRSTEREFQAVPHRLWRQ